MPVAVSSFGAVSSGGYVYFFGGHAGNRHEYSSNDVSGAFHRLDLATGREWEPLAASTPAQSPALAADDNYIYKVGGMAARNARGEPHNLWSHDDASRFNFQTRQWQALPDLPTPRSSHDGIVVNGKLFIVGGWALSGGEAGAIWATNALALDLRRADSKWQSVPQPFLRRGLCVAALGSKLYAIGGIETNASPTLAVSVLDTESMKWSDGPPLPPGKLKGFGNSACVVKGRLYVSGMSGVVWRLNRNADGWEEAARLGEARFFHRLVPGLDGRIIALGGEGDSGKLRSLEVISVK